MKLVKYKPPVDPYEHFILAMWVLFLATPCKRNADADGKWELGEIGSVREKDWARLTPYSLARPELTNG